VSATKPVLTKRGLTKTNTFTEGELQVDSTVCSTGDTTLYLKKTLIYGNSKRINFCKEFKFDVFFCWEGDGT